MYVCMSRIPVNKGANARLGWTKYSDSYELAPLQLTIHVVQNRHAGEQTSHWDKTNKGNYHLELCMPFICLVPVRLLLSRMAVLYHVNY